MGEEREVLIRISAYATFLTLVLVCGMFAVGTVSAQQVEISQAEDLNEVSAEGSYVVVDDIDASGIEGFEPIGDEENRFVGSFDGDGYVISGLTVNSSESEHVGLFGYVGSEGTVTNVGLENVEVKGGDSTGGLVGRNEGEVRRSHVTGSVEGGDNVGGLVGRNVGTVTESYASTNVVGEDRVGGLVGRNVESVSESYAKGSVEGASTVGGLVGSNVRGVVDSYATTDVEGENELGGLVGTDVGGTIERTYAGGEMGVAPASGGIIGAGNSNTEVTDSYWNRETMSEGRGEGVALMTSDMTGDAAVGSMEFEFGEGWVHRDNSYPALAWEVHGYEDETETTNLGVGDGGEDEDDNSSGSGEDDGYQPPDEGLPGFGVSVAAVALVVGGALIRRRS